ncbi:P-loop containing nucleoside triphosphate hydrolase protein [Geopyxis carbonaria]|nr:P-loop containing nucleoside triphosphate hydrolase protein [Geopyxis carbonaria]
MASTDDPKQLRYNRLFDKVRYNGLEKPSQGPLFLEAICSQPDVPTCISKLLSVPKGLDTLQECFFHKTTPEFFNKQATLLLRYLQDPKLKTVRGGKVLQQIAQKIVDPPYFWDDFVAAFREDQLTVEAQQCFAWLLLELVNLPKDEGVAAEDQEGGANAYIDLARDKDIQNRLIKSENSETRMLGSKLIHILLNLMSINSLGEEDWGPGGRHDNDKVDFREIAIFPTADELKSKDPAFFRIAKALDNVEPDKKVAMHLDNQFRLLREDMIKEMREELHIALGLKKGKHKGTVANGFEMAGIECDSGSNKSTPWGMLLRCTTDLPQLAHLKPSKRHDAVTKNKNLFRHNAQVCVIVDGEPVAFPTISRNEKLLSQIPPVVVLQFSGKTSTEKALVKLRTGRNVRLVQIDTPIFAYEPVLRRLQTIRELVLGEVVFAAASHSEVEIEELSDELSDVIVEMECDPEQDLKELLSLEKSVKLDASQSASLVMALKNRVSLIQGPPGTGKSHVGSLLGKVLHDKTSKTILVVCYTNHALDQFLEDLLDVGIPQQNIVRLGGKSTPRTKPLSLSEQPRKYNTHYTLINSLKAKVTALQTRLENAFEAYLNFGVSEQLLMEYMEFEEPDIFEALSIPTQPRGEKIVGKKGKAIGQYYLLRQWLSGYNAGVFAKQIPEDCQAVWDKDPSTRQAEAARWRTVLLQEEAEKVYELAHEYNDLNGQVEQAFKEKDSQTIQEKRIVACTTTAAAKYVQQLQAAAPDILLVEEAGEILESHVITALGKTTEQLILIGDHRQLRPKVANYDLTVEKGSGYDLNRSLFERLVLAGVVPHTTLTQQHRMRPEISALVRALTYPMLRDAASTKSRPNLRGFQHNVVFVNHDHPEAHNPHMADRPEDAGMTVSKQNLFEAEMVLKCVRYLGQQGYGTEKIVVLTPYLGQLQLLREVLGRENDPVLNDLDSYDLVRAGLLPAASAALASRPLLISTIDNYQGEERDIVVATLTRSNEKNEIGFMASPERLNVLISRARNALIMIGNARTFRDARSGRETWTKFFSLLSTAGQIHDGFPVECTRHPGRKALLAQPSDFDDSCPDGGCTEPCGTLLNCTVHTCPHKCHQLADHSKMQCEAVMTTPCGAPAAHQQQWQCFRGPPAACVRCEREDKDRRDKQLKDFAVKKEQEDKMREHRRKMALVDEDIEAERRALLEVQAEKDREAQLAQRKMDLEELRVRSGKSTKTAPRIVLSSQSPASPAVAASPAPTSAPAPGPIPTPTADTTPPAPTQAPVSPESTPGAAEPAPPPPPPNAPKPFKKYDSAAEKEWARQKSFENASNSAIDAIMDMVGLEAVKEQVLSIKAKIDVTKRQGTDLKDERLGVVMLGNPGTGKTTIARHYAKFLTSMSVLPGDEFVETTGSRLANDGVPGVKKHLEDITKAGGGCLFVDEAYQLTSPQSNGGPVLDFLLAEIENQVGTIVFILAGYNKQMEAFFEHNPGFQSRIPYTLQFRDYEDYELLEMLRKKFAKKFGGRMKIEEGEDGLYMRIVIRRLGRGRGKEGFGNARALENVLAKIRERQGDRLTRERREGQMPDDFYLTMEDLIGPDPTKAIGQSKEWKELQGLIGLETVKASLRSMFDGIENNYRRELREKEPTSVSLNRVFLGSPGTGKTSVAKLYGKVLADMGLLSNGEVVTKNPSDFTGAVLGASEQQTKSILETTVGKVLIIDEAYSLYSGGTSGGSGTSDPYKTAVIDTIVAEVQSVPGEDRCVLLLGYEDQMRAMFQNVNPGLSRRFAIDDAFHFQDFTIDQLLQILDLKLAKAEVSATEAAKAVAGDVLGRERRRPNFGNGGAVQNLIGQALSRFRARQAKIPVADRALDIVFEPQDFDPEFDRMQKTGAGATCRSLFEGMVGCEDVIAQLEGYQRMAVNMQDEGLDPYDEIPTNFIFKGPPGTGKTTTAKKMGQVFYDMGFLSSPSVHECSASDIVGQYVGHTGPLVKAQMTKALGQVLFIDEAYRLNQGPFAKEAIDELVDCVTKPQFSKKLLIILAGYDADMDALLSVNAGLASRFPEEVMFRHMTAASSAQLLHAQLKKKHLAVPVLAATESEGYKQVLKIFEAFAALPGWGNARDIINIAATLGRRAYQTKAPAARGLDEPALLAALREMLAEKQARSGAPQATTPPPSPPAPRAAPPAPAPPAPTPPKLATATDTAKARPSRQPRTPPTTAEPTRDPGVSDATWAALTAARFSATQRADTAAKKAAADKALLGSLAAAAKKRAAEMALLDPDGPDGPDVPDEEEKRRLEALRLQEQMDRIQAAKVRARLEAVEKERAEERRVQAKLRKMGVCVAGFKWVKMQGGWRCAGGAHFVTDAELGVGGGGGGGQ